jgi:CheY-like chemotaxis protein
MMPVMGGFEIREEQLSDPNLADIPVIVLSAVGDLQLKADSLRAAAYLQLPETDVAHLPGLLDQHCLK